MTVVTAGRAVTVLRWTDWCGSTLPARRRGAATGRLAAALTVPSVSLTTVRLFLLLWFTKRLVRRLSGDADGGRPRAAEAVVDFAAEISTVVPG